MAINYKVFVLVAQYQTIVSLFMVTVPFSFCIFSCLYTFLDILVSFIYILDLLCLIFDHPGAQVNTGTIQSIFNYTQVLEDQNFLSSFPIFLYSIFEFYKEEIVSWTVLFHININLSSILNKTKKLIWLSFKSS